MAMVPSGLAAVLRELGVDLARAQRSDGRLTLTFDGHRVDMLLLPGNRLAFSAEIAAIPAQGQARTDRLSQALRCAAAQLSTRHDVLVRLPEADALALQREMDSNANMHEVRRELTDFLDAVETWKLALRENVRPWGGYGPAGP